jgi:bla regulator protein blaR1
MTMTWFEAFFQWLLAASLRASLLAIGVLAAQATLQRWLPARWRYALWLPMVLVLVAPVLPPSRWSVENRFTRESLAMQAASRLLEESLPVGLNSAADCARLTITSLPEQTSVWATWLLGTTVTLAVAGAGYWRAWLRIRRGAKPADPEVMAAVSDGATQVGLGHPPRVIASAGVDSPAVAGLFRPTLLLPAEFPSGLTQVQMRLILLHELTHLRRFDLPLNWLLYVLQALHWFNPLLWYAFSRLRSDREAACDAQVLSGEGVDRRADYGHALLKLASAAPQSRLDLAFGGAFEYASLRFRLLAVTRHRRSHPAWSAVSIAVIVSLILAGATRARFENRPVPLALAQNEASEDGLTIDRIPSDFATACRELADGKVLSSWSTAALEGLLDIGRDWLSRSDYLPELRRLFSGWRVTATNADRTLDTKATVSLDSVGASEIRAQRQNIVSTFSSWSTGG